MVNISKNSENQNKKIHNVCYTWSLVRSFLYRSVSTKPCDETWHSRVRKCNHVSRSTDTATRGATGVAAQRWCRSRVQHSLSHLQKLTNPTWKCPKEKHGLNYIEIITLLQKSLNESRTFPVRPTHVAFQKGWPLVRGINQHFQLNHLVVSPHFFSTFYIWSQLHNKWFERTKKRV